MSGKIEHVLAQCIDDIMAGRASLEEVLGKHPSLRNELEPLLQIALGLKDMPEVKPSPALRSKARARIMEAISASKPASRGSFLYFPLGNVWKGEKRGRMFVKMAAVAAALLLVLGIGGGTVHAAQDSQFGEPLYPVKLATERVRLVLAFSASDKASTHLDIAQTRLDELTNATVAGKADVAKKLAAQYRSNVIEALARAAQATENRSERAKNRLDELQDRLQVHQSVLGALGNEMPEILDGKGKGQPEGIGKPGDVGKPESTSKPEGTGKPEGAGKPEDAGKAPGVGYATNECVWVQTGDQNRYQVWCCGVHLIVNLGDADEDEIEEWLTNEGLCVKAETAAEDEDATALIKALEDPESGVEQFNFYGPLSQLNLDRVENGGDVEDAEEAEEGEEANVTVQGNIRSMKGARWVLTVGDEERTVIVLGSASIEGVPQKGKKVEVTGKEKGDGTIQATIVVMIGD